MTKRFVPLVFLLVACSTGASEDSPSSFSASFTGNEAVADDDDTTDDGEPSTGDGDGDGEPSTGDGDGEPSTGDGDGEPSTGDGDGDGDVDPCPHICDGKANSTPNTCDKPYIIGRTKAKTPAGFFFGGSTQAATDDDNGTCGPKEDPANWDSGKDHFFRIFLVAGDVLTVVQNPSNWSARLKIHDEAECIGNAKVCSKEPDPTETIQYQAPKTDWFTIVADGQSAGFQDWGDYTLTVKLAQGPNVDECGCP
jgi:hypothetical protein